MSLLSLPDQVSDLRTLCKQADIVPGMLDIGSSFESRLQLYLASNLLTQFPSPILDLQNLRVLSLRNNNLTIIPPTIRELVNLEVLNVASNQLRELPFELIELARFHNLSKIISNPNPWDLDETDSANDQESQSVPCHTSFAPLANASGPTLTRAEVQLMTPGDSTGVQQSSIPSLTELVLRQLSKTVSRSQPDLSTLMPFDTPASVLEPLRLIHSQPGRQCTRCHRNIVIPYRAWLEWWSMERDERISPDQMGRVPFRRLLCSNSCQGGDSHWCDNPPDESQK